MSSLTHPVANTHIKTDESMWPMMFILVPVMMWAAFAATGPGFGTFAGVSMKLHAGIMFAGLLGGVIYIIGKMGSDPPKIDHSRYADKVVKYGVIATTFWGIAGKSAGV